MDLRGIPVPVTCTRMLIFSSTESVVWKQSLCMFSLGSDRMIHVTRIVNYLIISVKTIYIHGKIPKLWYFTGNVCIVWYCVFVFAESILFVIL